MKKRKILIVLLTVLAVVIVGGAALYLKLSQNLAQLEALTITEVDLSRAADGDYTGSYSTFPVSAEVRVSIADHRITAIELVRHDHGQGKPAEVIPQQVVAAQSLQVDSISGATYSSRVILKAIEAALLEATR